MIKKISILAIAVLLFSISCGKKKDPEKEADAFKVDAKINLSLGDVKINGKPAKDGALVNFGDIIETGNDGVCQIIIGSKNLIKLNTNSKLTFNVSKDISSLVLDRGWMAGVTRQKFTKEGKYTIKTPTAIAAIRGTSYCVKVESPESTYFCVCNGTINLEGKGEKGEDVTAAHHAAKRFTLDKSGRVKTDSKVGMLYHNDKGVEELAEKIQEKVDWKKAF